MSSGAKKSDGASDNCKDGLTQLTDLLKFTITLATGSLVFSAGLISETLALDQLAKWFLLSSWILLALSVACGILAYLRIPVLLAKGEFNIRDKLMEVPGRIHHIAFLLGIICLGVSLVLALGLF